MLDDVLNGILGQVLCLHFVRQMTAGFQLSAFRLCSRTLSVSHQPFDHAQGLRLSAFERRKFSSVLLFKKRKEEKKGSLVCLDINRLRPSFDGLRRGFTSSNEASTNDVGFASKYTDLLVEGFTIICMLWPLNLMINAGESSSAMNH